MKGFYKWYVEQKFVVKWDGTDYDGNDVIYTVVYQYNYKLCTVSK